MSHRFFDAFILFLILLNCMTMLIFNEPVLEAMIESNDDYRNSVWADSQWLSTIFKPMGDCSLQEAGPCSMADWIDFAFLICFAVEMLLKMTAYGLIAHPNSYLRSGWCLLDFIVVVVGFVEMFTVGLPGISTLRLVKTLRPLRSLQRIRGMRVLVQCILEAMPQMCNVLIFLVFIIILFGLFGVSFFKGTLRHACHAYNADSGEWESTGDTCDAECEWDESTVRLIGTCGSLGANTRQMESYKWPGRWTYSCRAGEQCRCAMTGEDTASCSFKDNPNYGITSFDSLVWAMISLFQAISLEGWVDMMYQLMDGCSFLVVFYFILLVLFGAIIVINLFLAVLCDNFEMADRDAGEKEFEEDGEEEVRKESEQLQHTNPIRKFCLGLVRYKYFDWFIQGCILINTIFMMIKYAPRPTDQTIVSIDANLAASDYMPRALWLFLTVANILLTTIFTLESVIKIIGLGPRLFMKDRMNVFDFFVVAFSIVEIALDLTSRISGSEVSIGLPLSVLRAFRIFRLFKLVRSIDSLRKIITTLAESMASVVYLAGLLGLMIVIFILLGMELFGGFYPRPELQYTNATFPHVWKDNSITWDEDFASRYHFDDVGTAFLSIFVVLSGENWNEIMFASHRATWDHDTDSLFPIPFAIPYFLLLFIIGNLLLFNLFIAIRARRSLCDPPTNL